MRPDDIALTVLVVLVIITAVMMAMWIVED